LLSGEQVTPLLGQLPFDGLLVRLDEAEAAIQVVERQPRRGIVEQFRQGGAGQPMEDAAFAAWLDQAVDGDEGGDHGHGHARADAAQESLQ
jgi:hypothetical protein